MATAIDDNAAYEKSDKSIWRLLNIRCTRELLTEYKEIKDVTECLNAFFQMNIWIQHM